MARPSGPIELLVCTRCRRGSDAPEDAERPGSILYQTLARHGIEGVSLTPVECLSNCSQGCTVVLRGPGRWTYVYGRVDPATDADTVREGAAKYAATSDGLIPWRERPQHFRKNCIARVPPVEPAAPILGET
ncbi:MAG: DUF1636 domain-containing protein [Pseudomonadota bacterium]